MLLQFYRNKNLFFAYLYRKIFREFIWSSKNDCHFRWIDTSTMANAVIEFQYRFCNLLGTKIEHFWPKFWQFLEFDEKLNLHSAVWKNDKFTFTEINHLVISLVKPLLSRNFCQKYVRVIFRNFYTAVLKYMISCCFHEIFFRCMK